MGRRSLFDMEKKVETCEAYLRGEKSIKYLAHELAVHPKTISTWIVNYQANGAKIFIDKPRNRKYTQAFKLAMVKRYLAGEGSFLELATKYQIMSMSSLYAWVNRYNKGEMPKTYEPRGEVYNMKSRKTTAAERKSIVEWYLNNGKSYSLTAANFKVPYALVYTWVKKYLTHGPDSLVYQKRGRHLKPDVDQSPLGQLRYELTKTKQALSEAQMTIEVLKKKNEIEQRLTSQKFVTKSTTKQSKN